MENTGKLADKMEQSVNPKEAKIIRGHITMLSDPFMVSQMEDLIKNDNKCAEAAAETVLDMFKSMFAQADDELTKQRATDVEDIKTRLLKILLGIRDVDLKNSKVLVIKLLISVLKISPNIIAIATKIAT